MLALLLLASLGTVQAYAAKKKITKGDAKIAKRSAHLYISQRLFDKALAQLLVVIEGDPEDVQAHFMLGEIYSEKNMQDEMRKEFEWVLATKKGKKKYAKKIQPYLDMWWSRNYNNAVRAIGAEDYGAAIESLQKAIALAPGKPMSYQALGVAYLNMGQAQAGIDAYEKAVELDSTEASSFVNLGRAYMNMKNYDEATQCFARAHRLAPDNAGFLNDLARAQQFTGDTAAALESAEKALAIEPDNLDVLMMAGQMQLLGGDYEQAAGLLERVAAQKPEDVDNLFNLAECYRNLGRVDEAVNLFLKSVQANPQDADAWFRLGRIYEKQGRLTESIEALKMVVSLRPTSVKGWQALSRSWALLSKEQSDAGMDDAASASAKSAEEAYNMSTSLQEQGGG
ncbi:MAG: tetratricopeptide repeat protein [Candidatus Latescibacteria bacterium]|nr:tetratricopeptide repeat protein [Candidatus Latescibacterota bacterium]